MREWGNLIGGDCGKIVWWGGLGVSEAIKDHLFNLEKFTLDNEPPNK